MSSSARLIATLPSLQCALLGAVMASFCVLLAFSFFLECQLANVRLSLQSFSDVPSTVPIALIIFCLSKLVDHLLASFVIFIVDILCWNYIDLNKGSI